MAKRGRKPKKRPLRLNIPSSVLQTVISVILIFFSVLITVSFFAPEPLFNKVVQNVLTKLFGFGVIFVPILLSYFGIFFFRSLRWKILESRVMVGIVLLFISTIGIMGSSGGLIGKNIFDILSRFVAPFGAGVTLFFILIISLILILELSFDSLNQKMRLFYGRLRNMPFLPKLPVLKKKDAVLESKDAEFAGSSKLQEKEYSKKDFGPSFEVIPNKAEPVGENGNTKNLKELEAVSNLPYTDEIWQYPPISLLSDSDGTPADRGDIKGRAAIIEKTLDSFGIKVRVVEVNAGPAVTQYALETSQGTKIAKITSLQNDLALSLASPTGSVRVEAPIPGKSLIGIEVPNFSPELVTLKQVLESDIMSKVKSKLAIALGNDVSGKPVIADIKKMPHALIAGSTGSGKSVMLHSIISTILFRCSPSECKFIFVDPKRVELTNYRDIPHLLTPPITDINKALPSFKWAISEMERRYKLFENAKVRDVDSYNDLSGFQALPYIVIVVDELADLMITAPVDIERAICRLAQMARATGIHLILATQRPSVNVLTGLIKANIPCRVAFNVTSQIDSRVIIDHPGAEKLLGRGDMLYVPPDASKPTRIQGVFVSDKERGALVDFLKQSPVEPDYKEEVTEEYRGLENSSQGLIEGVDNLFNESIVVVASAGKASASLLQRKLSIGYARAARILDELEAKGVVGPADGSKPRDVLITDPLNIR